ncbi:hypothetical protein [Nocardia carnea]|uniref:hypothetical protein n=1 Tax=Nocardia carnea TaxID=37328 RepID=UPI0024539811|nr:hypothetical protein [Nocardia carnea]
MSRRRSKPNAVREQSQAHGQRMAPVSELPHLAEAAARRGESDRKVLVDLPAPQQVRTPGRSVGTWLGSGKALPPVPPQYVTEADIAAAEQARQKSESSNAFAGLSTNAFAAGRDQKGMSR